MLCQKWEKAKEEDVLKAFVTAFTKDQTLLLDAIHYIYMNRAEGVVKVKLLEDLFAHPRFCWSILHSLIDSDNIPNVKLQVSDEKDVKAEIKRIKLLEHFLLYDSFKINIQTTVPGDQEGNTILHLLAKKERSHSAILSLLLSHLRDIVNSANIGGFTPYLVSVYYKQLWAISCFNLTTSEVNKEAKNAQGQSAEDLAGNDEKVKHAISQIKLEPIGLLPANRKQNSDAFHEKYPTLFLSSRRESAVCSSASYDSISNSLSVSLSFSSSSFSSSFTSSPLCSNRSSELEDPLSPRGSTPSQSFSGGKAESPAQIQLTPRWQMSKSIVYREFERMLENDKQSISKSLQALFTESNLKDKGELLGDLFTLFDAHHCAVQYFEELNQYAQKKYEELLTVNNDLTSQLMYQLITPPKADAAITNLKIDRTKIKTDHPARELSPAASGLIRKKLSKDANNALTAKELDSKLHLREALFILTSKGHLSKNWQVEFDTILSSIIGLQVLYSLEEILTVLNELYNKFDSRQILAGNLLIFQLMLYNANEFFTQSHLIEKANQFIHRGFEEGSEPGFVRKRVRSILQQLITVNQKFYSESFISNYDLLNQWFLKRRPNISFECLIDQGIKQKENYCRPALAFRKRKNSESSVQCHSTINCIRTETSNYQFLSSSLITAIIQI